MSEKRLWKRFSGEPFMVNPQLGILGAVNPRKIRKGKTVMAARRRRGRKYMAWVRSFQKNRRHRRHRSNPWPVGGLVVNPRRRRFRRNPSLAGLSLPPLTGVLYVGAGFIGCGAIETFITPYLPLSVTESQIGKWAVRIGSVIGLSFIAKAVFGSDKAKMVAIGGGAYVLVKAARELLPAGTIPGLNAYRPMAAYRPLAARQPMGLPAGASPIAVNAVASRFQRF